MSHRNKPMLITERSFPHLWRRLGGGTTVGNCVVSGPWESLLPPDVIKEEEVRLSMAAVRSDRPRWRRPKKGGE